MSIWRGPFTATIAAWYDDEGGRVVYDDDGDERTAWVSLGQLRRARVHHPAEGTPINFWARHPTRHEVELGDLGDPYDHIIVRRDADQNFNAARRLSP